MVARIPRLRTPCRHAPSLLCPLISVRSYVPEGVHVPQCMPERAPSSSPALIEAGQAASGDAGLGDDSCFCGSPQFHIVRFNHSCYTLPSREAMGGHRK